MSNLSSVPYKFPIEEESEEKLQEIEEQEANKFLEDQE